MSMKTPSFVRRNPRKVVAAAVLALAAGGALVSAPAAAENSPHVLAAPPEVWEASDASRALPGGGTTVFQFSVPAGHYAIVAKLTAQIVEPLGTATVTCRLDASSGGASNWDISKAGLYPPGVAPAAIQTMTLSVVHTYASGGVVKLSCSTGQDNKDVDLTFVKITATRVNALTHIGL
jgi:hypothetical protein